MFQWSERKRRMRGVRVYRDGNWGKNYASRRDGKLKKVHELNRGLNQLIEAPEPI